MRRLRKILLLVMFIPLLLNISGCDQSNVNEDDNREYGFVIASGGGYNIVATLSGGGETERVGVIDNDGNWIHELSENHPLIYENGYIRRTAEILIHNPTTNIMTGQELTAEQRISIRNNTRARSITESYRHSSGSIFELINEYRQGGVLREEVMLRYCARGNVIAD